MAKYYEVYEQTPNQLRKNTATACKEREHGNIGKKYFFSGGTSKKATFHSQTLANKVKKMHERENPLNKYTVVSFDTADEMVVGYQQTLRLNPLTGRLQLRGKWHGSVAHDWKSKIPDVKKSVAVTKEDLKAQILTAKAGLAMFARLEK